DRFLGGIFDPGDTVYFQNDETATQTGAQTGAADAQKRESGQSAKLADHPLKKPATPAEKPKINLLDDQEGLYEAWGKLIKKFPERFPDVYGRRTYFTPDSIKIKFVNPQNSWQADHYRYDAASKTWLVEGRETISDRDPDYMIEPVDKIGITQVYFVYKQIVELSKDVPGVEPVTHIYRYRETPLRAFWTSRVRGSGGNYDYTADETRINAKLVPPLVGR
ncbi:MAG: hypothetical protein Q4C71_06340, partial [Microbacteriaceae bacterium]|nr:hypothetical protein [Microbacteriaceae bacterium]